MENRIVFSSTDSPKIKSEFSSETWDTGIGAGSNSASELEDLREMSLFQDIENLYATSLPNEWNFDVPSRKRKLTAESLSFSTNDDMFTFDADTPPQWLQPISSCNPMALGSLVPSLVSHCATSPLYDESNLVSAKTTCESNIKRSKLQHRACNNSDYCGSSTSSVASRRGRTILEGECEDDDDDDSASERFSVLMGPTSLGFMISDEQAEIELTLLLASATDPVGKVKYSIPASLLPLQRITLSVIPHTPSVSSCGSAE
jgi:hypothetical protein